MHVRRIIFASLLLLLAACGEKEPVVKPALPAVRIEQEEVQETRASFLVHTIQCGQVRYGAAPSGTSPQLDRVMPAADTGTDRVQLILEGLEPGSPYTLGVQGIGPAGEQGRVESFPFSTAEASDDLYAWERARSSCPIPADMTLIPGPSSHRSPLAWDEERWKAHVSYTGPDGNEHWLFDSFLLIEGQQNGTYGQPITTFVITDDDRPSGTRSQWQQLLDFWFKGGSFPWQESYWGNGVDSFGRWYTGETFTLSFPEGQLDALEACVAGVSARIGPPAQKRLVIMALPEPIYFDNYIRAIRNGGGSTIYWGSLDGRALDFSKAEDRIAAYIWFMDETRKAFAEKAYQHIELGGFYILPEVLSTTWRAEYKRYDQVIPAVAAYAHQCRESLFWIPYCMADGYKTWKDFGFDLAYMQPNYYWEPEKKPMAATFREINRYSMGLELEFEYSLVENVNGTASAQTYRERFAEYLSWAKSSGLYGQRSIALYSGTDAMHQLATSPLAGDRAMYQQLCQFVIESPLKK